MSVDPGSTPARIATAGINAHHSEYTEAGAITPDPTLVAGYDADQPDVGTHLVVMDRDGWGTLHIIERREAGKIEFGPRVPWPDGSLAARRLGP
jgi:hypothetical protein